MRNIFLSGLLLIIFGIGSAAAQTGIYSSYPVGPTTLTAGTTITVPCPGTASSGEYYLTLTGNNQEILFPTCGVASNGVHTTFRITAGNNSGSAYTGLTFAGGFTWTGGSPYAICTAGPPNPAPNPACPAAEIANQVDLFSCDVIGTTAASIEWDCLTPQYSIGYTGPGDVQTGASGWWGLRGYSRAYSLPGTNKAVKIRRTSDNETCDLLIAPSGRLGNTANCSGSDNGETDVTFCASTTCFVNTLYDQSGNSHDATQSTTADQPQYTPNCIGTLPCMQFNGSAYFLAITLGSAVSQPLTVSTVVNRTGGTSNFGQVFSAASGGAIAAEFNNTTNTPRLYPGTTGANAAANDNAYHSIQYFISGSSSSFFIDGTSTSASSAAGTGTTTTSPNIGADGAGDYLTGNITEVALYASAIANAAMCHNQTYWGAFGTC
jgi:hypothetical protein